MAVEQTTDHLPPLFPATSVPPGEYPRARFDEGLGYTVKETGRQRAPTPDSRWRHEVGFAGELAVSGLLGVPVNKEIHNNYEGDDGYDLKYRGSRIEVKTVSTGNEELSVHESKLPQADYFVLCRTVDPRHEVEVIGSITRPRFRTHGTQHPRDSEIKIQSRFLAPLPPIFINPRRIRDAQS